MGTLSLAVEHALSAKNVGDRGIGGRVKFARPLALGRYPVQIIFFCFLVLVDLFDLVGIGFSELLRHCEFDFRILCPGDRELARERQLNGLGIGIGVGALASQFERVGTRSGFQAYSGQGEPGFAGRIKTGAPLTSRGGSARTVKLAARASGTDAAKIRDKNNDRSSKERSNTEDD